MLAKATSSLLTSWTLPTNEPWPSSASICSQTTNAEQQVLASLRHLMNNRLWRPKRGKCHALVGRQISRLLTKPIPLDGCPMFAFLRTWVEDDGRSPSFFLSCTYGVDR